jgi:hypothetical protein
MRKCTDCQSDIPASKRWGYANLCDCCDTREYESKHVAVIIADGKTDYHFQLVRNPTEFQAAKIRSLGLAHDPRTQLRFTGKGQYNERKT